MTRRWSKAAERRAARNIMKPTIRASAWTAPESWVRTFPATVTSWSAARRKNRTGAVGMAVWARPTQTGTKKTASARARRLRTCSRTAYRRAVARQSRRRVMRDPRRARG
ncbi:hypothetical protein ACFQVA_39135 [Actinomadura keratinilytica]